MRLVIMKTLSQLVRLLALVAHLVSDALCLCGSFQSGSDVIYDCSSQTITNIPTYIPDYTTHLNMSSNPISTLTSPMLQRFFNIKVLDVSNTYLTIHTLPADLFSDLNSLEELYIVKTRSTKLNSPTLKDSKITILRLDRNNIRHLPADFLVDVPMLVELSLSGCGLQTISPHAFRSMGNSLRSLDLSDNHLETLSVEVKPDLFTSKLRSIHLNDNFWICDCHLRWLREELDTTSAAWYFHGYSVVPLCEEPKSLKHVNWFKAQTRLFGCEPELASIQSDVYVPLGGNTTLNCTVHAYMQPDLVEWVSTTYKTINYSSRLRSAQTYSDGVLTSLLLITDASAQDYGQYNCTVATQFGSVVQTVEVIEAAPVDSGEKSSIMIAVIIVVVVILAVLVVVAAIFIKKYLVRRGKLYMDGSEMSTADDVDASRDKSNDMDGLLYGDEDETCLTPLNVTVSSGCVPPDVIKGYTQDELDALPAESEYPADDAGCAEYNKYLDAVSSANNSPVYSSDSSNTNTKQPVQSQRMSPNPLYSRPNHVSSPPLYESVSDTAPLYAARQRSPEPSNHMPAYSNTRTAPLVPYSLADTPGSVHSPVEVAARLNSTPPMGNSPLTFIREEPEEGNPDLL